MKPSSISSLPNLRWSMIQAESKCPATRSKVRFRSSLNVARRCLSSVSAGMQKPNWMRVIAFPIQSWPNDLLGVAVCQRFEHIRTPLGNRHLGYLNELIAVEPTVPLLRDAVDPLSVLER